MWKSIKEVLKKGAVTPCVPRIVEDTGKAGKQGEELERVSRTVQLIPPGGVSPLGEPNAEVAGPTRECTMGRPLEKVSRNLKALALAAEALQVLVG